MTPWTLRYALFLALTLALTAFIGYGTYATARLLRHWRPNRNLLLIPEENLARVGMIGICVGLGWLSGLPPQQLGWTWEPVWPQVMTGGLVGLALALFFYTSTRLLLRFTGRRFYSTVLLEHVVPSSLGELVQVLLALVPVVVLEELLFRSLLLGGLSVLVDPLWPVILLGILFGLMHSPQGIWGMVGAGLAGILFGVLFLAWHSLLTPLIAHYVANAVQIVLAMPERDRLLGQEPASPPA